MEQRALKKSIHIASLCVLSALASVGVCLGRPQTSPQDGANQTSSLYGVVTTLQNGSQVAVAGVTVNISRDPSTGTSLSAQTGENGRYEFQKLEAGSYSISISATGFKALTQPIVLAPREQKVQDFVLQLEAVSEKVEVNETAAGISTESSAPPPVTVTNTELITLPTPQEKVKDVIAFAPGVIKTPDSKLAFKGADENQSLLLVNSARTTDPVTGSFNAPIPTDAVESFSVDKTPYDASLGSFSGGLTTIETKPPEDKWDFRVRSVIPTVRGKEGHIVGLSEAIPGVALDAPLIPHKLLFFEVFQYDMKKYTIEGLPWPHDVSKKQGFNSFSTLEAILSPHHLLTLTVNAFPLRWQNYDINALVPIPASNDLNQSGVAVGLADRYQFSSGAVFSFISQYMRFDSNAHGQGTADMVISPEGYGGNYFNQWSRRGKEFQAIPSFQLPRKRWHGSHDIRVGMDIDWRSFYGTTESNPIHIIRQDNSVATNITFVSGGYQNPSDSSIAEFVQDHWILNSQWSVDLGARLSSETSGWPGAFAPRAGLAYSPGTSGKTVIRAGAGLFYGLVPLLASNFAANPTRTITEYDPAGVQIGSPVTYTNVYVGRVDPLVSTNFPSQPGTTPRNFTWNGQVQQELRRNLNLRVGYLDSHTSYLFNVVPFTSTTGGESFMGLTNTGSSHYRELETTLHYKFGERDQVNASYVWSQARGNLNSLSSIFIPFAAPVIRPNVYGILPSDVPNRLVAYGIFAIPWKMTFSPLVDVHTGYPFSSIDERQQYVGTPNGERFPTYFSLDLKVYREFRIPFLGNRRGKVHHFRFGAYTLNVTNHGNFNAVYNNVTSPFYGTFVGFLYRHEGLILDFVD
jgi:Carboxypeptidase regulatory-like domain